MRVLVVTAVAEEADAVLRGLAAAGLHGPVDVEAGAYRLSRCRRGEAAVDVLVGGVGPSAAAASTAAVLALEPADLVVDAGVAGGFAPRAGVDAVVLADRVVAADLGAEQHDDHAPDDGDAHDPHDRFVPLDAMGFGPVEHRLDGALVDRAAGLLRDACGEVVVGTVLTVSTVTGSPASTARLRRRHPEAVAEGMEGFAVVTAALPHGVPVLELRTVCNPVGVSDRTRWDLPGAFARLTDATAALLADPAALAAAPAGASDGAAR